MTLDDARAVPAGTRVVYNPRRKDARPEQGRITSVGNHYVFVRFAGQLNYTDGKAVAPEFLSFAHEPARAEQM